MRLHHLALWSRRIELLRDFYTTYFDGRAGEKYENPAKGFESYFVTFADGVSLELMRRTADGHPVLSEPRITGDGYYESAVGDPDGNLVELVYKA